MHALGVEEMLCCIQPLGGFVVVASEVSVESKSEVLMLAIVDDDHHPYTIDLAIPYWEVEMEGMFSAMPLECEGRSLNTLVELIKEQAKGAICIHRLAQREATNFFGAELVAALYDLKIPALLVTQYRDIDFSTSIRKWRDKIPVVLHPREVSSETVKEHFDICRLEVQGKFSEQRKPYRVFLYALNVEHDGPEAVVDVIIPYWDHYQVARFPLDLVPQEMRKQVVAGRWLYAHVNIGAQSVDDLYFRQIELTVEPDDEGYSYCFDILEQKDLISPPLQAYLQERASQADPEE